MRKFLIILTYIVACTCFSAFDNAVNNDFRDTTAYVNPKPSSAAKSMGAAFNPGVGLTLAAVADAYRDVDLFWGSGATDSPVSEGMARGWNWEKAQSGNTHPGAVAPFGWVSACAYSGAYPTGYGRVGTSWFGPAGCDADRKSRSLNFSEMLAYGIPRKPRRYVS